MKTMMKIMIGLLLASASVQADEAVVQMPLADVRFILLACIADREGGIKLVNNSEDHPAFEIPDPTGMGVRDGCNVYIVARFKFVPSMDSKSTLISATVEEWIERKPGSYPDTVLVKTWGKESADADYFVHSAVEAVRDWQATQVKL